MGTEYTFSCSTREAIWGLTNLTQSSKARNPLWVYAFNHSMSFDWGKGFEFCNGHACELIVHVVGLGLVKYHCSLLVP